jgi:hypothetical protein
VSLFGRSTIGRAETVEERDAAETRALASARHASEQG